MGNADSAVAQLDLALKRLDQRWEDTKSRWDDSVQRDFEKTHWVPLRGETLATVEEMRVLSQAIAKARKKVR